MYLGGTHFLWSVSKFIFCRWCCRSDLYELTNPCGNSLPTLGSYTEKGREVWERRKWKVYWGWQIKEGLRWRRWNGKPDQRCRLGLNDRSLWKWGQNVWTLRAVQWKVTEVPPRYEWCEWDYFDCSILGRVDLGEWIFFCFLNTKQRRGDCSNLGSRWLEPEEQFALPRIGIRDQEQSLKNFNKKGDKRGSGATRREAEEHPGN